MNYKLLQPPGWKKSFEQYTSHIDFDVFSLGRISAHHGQLFEILTPSGKLNGILAGNFHLEAGKDNIPVVGDMVIIQVLDGEKKAVIKEIIPRISYLSRKRPGSNSDEQPIAANIDLLFIVQGLDNDFNIRRLERYLLMSIEMNIEPVIVLNKTDLCPDINEKITLVKDIAPTTPVITISAQNEEGLDCIVQYLSEGITAVFLGSSGVGKSTIVNKLLGEEKQKTLEVRGDDSKGRHATTVRQLFILHSGGMVIDTPGMRELEPWDAEESINTLFEDIELLALNCKFKNCTHNHEPGCNVQKAVSEGVLLEGRLNSYNKLLREQQYQLSLVDEKASFERRKKDKEFGKMCKRIMKDKK